MSTWRHLRDVARDRLGSAGFQDVPQEVRWMLEQASGLAAAEQAAALDAAADEVQAAAFEAMVERRSAGEPLQYVLGRWGFRTLDLFVDPRVLIPRPETEVVAGLAIDLLATRAGPTRAADLGTGSGAIALSLAAECWPDVEVWATDASPDALAVARANLAALGRRAGVVRLLEGDWFDALPPDLHGTLDVVVANPPYVAAADDLPASVADWEPRTALIAGPTGLEDVERIVAGAPAWLVADGALVLEIGETQADAVRALAGSAGFASADILPDLAGRPRARWSHAVVDSRAVTAVLALELGDDLEPVVEPVVEALLVGGVVVLPTDTVYGLAALAADAAATARLFGLKGRRSATPIAVLCADVRQAATLVPPEDEAHVRSVGERWWPGPLTLVCRRRAGVELHLGEPAHTVGLRVPDHPLVRAVAARVGPLATTSANPHGSPTAVTAGEVLLDFGDGIAVVVDGGPLSGRASTVVDTTTEPWRALRDGPVPAAEVIRSRQVPLL